MVCTETYISAFAGALSAEAEDLFLSLERKRLIRALTGSRDEVFYIFQMLPFFERTEYIFHAMENHSVKDVLMQLDIDELSLKEKQMVGSRRFLASRILKSVTRYTIKNAVSACAKSNEAFLFLEYLAKTLPAGTWNDAVYNAENISDAGLCIKVLEALDGSPLHQIKTTMLMAKARYDKSFVKILHKKVQADPKRYICETDEYGSCMTAAWVLDRADILRAGESAWWDDNCENTVLYAMLHKWERFLAGLADNKKLQAAAAYLGDKCSQINVNMFSDGQLARICEQNMLSDPLPGWMIPATYDQILAFYEIQESTSGKLKSILKDILQELCGKLRSETAGKRMVQFVQAWCSSEVDREIDRQEAEEIVSCLCEKDLYAWAAEVFAFKHSHAQAAMSLPYIRGNSIFKETRTEKDAWFVLRNLELCKNGLERAKEKICKTDRNVLDLKKKLQLGDEFYQKYWKESTEFLLESTDIAMAYADGMNESYFKKFRLIVKAAMCGKLAELKFHDGDLASEIGMFVDRQTTDIWINDLKIQCMDKFHGACAEDSSFNGIMSIGSRLGYTCMNYKNGTYKECLMSYFDANKKILYRMDKDGKTIARAVLRFTKATDAEKKQLDFIDIEENIAETKEYPVLFLERMYSGYQGGDRKVLAESLVMTAKEKAAQMGVALVLANDYASLINATRDGFEKGCISIYITKSKSSAQYLDSFGGKKSCDSGEDTYMAADCLVQTG